MKSREEIKEALANTNLYSKNTHLGKIVGINYYSNILGEGYLFLVSPCYITTDLIEVIKQATGLEKWAASYHKQSDTIRIRMINKERKEMTCTSEKNSK